MTHYTKTPFGKGEFNQELAKLFSALMDNNLVSAVLAPANHSPGIVKQTLMVDSSKTSALDPFAPVVPVNSAKIASSLTARPSGKKIAMVMRSCEVRASIELAKLNQVNLEDILLIGIDCYGRYENLDYLKLSEQGLTTESFLQSAQTGTTEIDDKDIVDACKICEFPVPDNVDIRLCTIGVENGTFGVEGVSEKGRNVLDAVGYKGKDAAGKRTEAADALAEKRMQRLNEQLDAYRESTNSIQALEESLANCVNCYNCRVACPVCYCKECVYATDTFRHEGEQFLGWAQRNGSLKMPTDTTFYHLTRMAHISSFCVGCGQCTSACPNDVKLTLAFRSVARDSQARFDYQAGRSLEEQQPLTVFHDEELMEVTGQVK